MRLTQFGKRFVAKTATNPAAWKLYSFCGRASEKLAHVYACARSGRSEDERDQKLRDLSGRLFPDLTVMNGPFSGLRYPSARSCGSTILPKLLGSYEAELHPVIDAILRRQYSAIVDIGCAEGYYAVGLGQKFTNATIYAFDIDDNARKSCIELATLNGVAARLRMGSFCNEETLRTIQLGQKALIISDCEGYEARLFTKEMARFLAPHDILIETHDFIDIDISTMLKSTFSETHAVSSITSIDDIQKAHTYSYSIIAGLDTKTKALILSEIRPAIMEWLFIQSIR